MFIGAVTFTGSLVAFGKLSGKMSSKAKIFPGRHAFHSALVGTNIAALGGFLHFLPVAPQVALGCLAGNAFLSFVTGWTTTNAIGGADMPVAITVLNAYSGFALIAEGIMLNNNLLTSVGAIIGSSGSILSWIMVSQQLGEPSGADQLYSAGV